MSIGFRRARGADNTTGVPGQGRAALTPADVALGRTVAGSAAPVPAAAGPGDLAPAAASAVPAVPGRLFLEDRAARRRKIAVLAVVLAVLTVASLFIDSGYGWFFDPGEVFACYGVWFQQAFASLTGAPTMSGSEILDAGHMAYYRIMTRAATTVMTVLCGAVLAVAGTLYQSAFRNPIASPSMLGVSSAIQLGDALLVLAFGTAAATHLGWRYLICYGCVIVVMVALFGASRLMTGKGRPFNVVNLLLCAMIITQIIGVMVTYITMFMFSWEQWEVYQNVSEGITPDLTVLGWGALLAACFIGLLPVVLLRFRLNGLSFDDAEMRLLGIDASRLRFVAIGCGTVLLMGVQVQMGTVALLALVVPHVSRMVFGAEFRKQFWGNVFIGASLLVLCRIVVPFVPYVGSFLPISVVLNFLVLPFFMWMLATQQRGWEQ